jgi:hypothetical protein
MAAIITSVALMYSQKVSFLANGPRIVSTFRTVAVAWSGRNGAGGELEHHWRAYNYPSQSR